MNLLTYKTLVFDCDGVILNSNKTKVWAYYEVAKRMGGTDAQAQALAAHHVQQGSFPRNGKIEFYLREILHQPVTDKVMQHYMDTFDEVLDDALMHCEIAPGLAELKSATAGIPWMLLSGGDQRELRKIFQRRDLTKYFELGIFGGPDIKEHVLARELSALTLKLPALFIGDSKYDYQAATQSGLDFVFLTHWTEVADWQQFCLEHRILTLPNLNALNAIEIAE